MKWLALVSLALCSSLVGCMNMAAREAAPATLETWDADGATSEPGFVSYKDAGRSADSAGAPAQGPSEVLLEAPKAARQVIYSASLSIVVLSPAAAQASVKSLAEAAGGWMSESDARTITVRVPAAQFEVLLERVGQLGEVVDRSVRAEDITETLVELDIRIDNARRARERLVAHLEKSEKMEDTLRIEAELARVTVELEALEGRARFLRSQVAMSTLRVSFNRAQTGSRGGDGMLLPFEWIVRLGDGLVAGSVEGRPRRPGLFASGPRFDPPSAFLRYYSDPDTVEAMNADGVRIKVHREDNYDKGALAFWSKLARAELVRSRALVVASERDLGEDRALVAGSREVAGVLHDYLLVIARTKDDVYTFEAWGPRELFAPLAAELEKSALSLRR